MDYDPQFLEPEYHFEWGGVFQLDAGQYEFVCGDGPDPAMNAVLLKSTSGDDAGRKAVEHDAVLTYSESEREVGPRESIATLSSCPPSLRKQVGSSTRCRKAMSSGLKITI